MVLNMILEQTRPFERPYVFGLSEIDSQHEEIGMLLSALQEAAENPVRRASLAGILEVLQQRLKAHFEVEEAVLNLFGLRETNQHLRSHEEILLRVDFCRQHVSAGETRDVLFLSQVQALVSQIRGHDHHFVDYIDHLRIMLHADLVTTPDLRPVREPFSSPRVGQFG